MSALFSLTGALVGMVVLSVQAWATMVVEQSLSDLVQKADTIVVGTVAGLETEWGRYAPHTLVTLSDLDVLKGDANQPEITIHILGGPTPDGMRLHLSGTPQFHSGERMVLFVAGNGTQAVPFVGIWRGVYRILTDAETGREIIATYAGRPLTALPQRQPPAGLVHDGPHRSVQPHQAPALSLDHFLHAIEEEIRHERRHAQ